jgi:gamma-glutamyltranspeptidase/glutathione hydrolase
MSSISHLGADYCHLTASAIRIARENVRRWIGDPEYYFVPVDSILSPARIAEVRETIEIDSLLDTVKPMSEDRSGDPVHGNTTHLVVADKSGSLMCLTQSINYYFGAAVMSPRWGYVLNNLMADFDHDTVGINSMHPYHRPASTMACTIIMKDGKPLVVIGTPGGTRIASTMTQVIVGMIDYGLTLEQALAAPRFYTAGKRLAIENRFTEEVRAQLTAKGWKMDPMEAFDAYFGGVNAIYIDPQSGDYIGCSDPRRDGAASGF